MSIDKIENNIRQTSENAHNIGVLRDFFRNFKIDNLRICQLTQQP